MHRLWCQWPVDTDYRLSEQELNSCLLLSFLEETVICHLWARELFQEWKGLPFISPNLIISSAVHTIFQAPPRMIPEHRAVPQIAQCDLSEILVKQKCIKDIEFFK